LGGEIYRASKGEFDKLYATQANFQNLEAKVANFNSVSTTFLKIGFAQAHWTYIVSDIG
jgi:oligoendopeptidase F